MTRTITLTLSFLVIPGLISTQPAPAAEEEFFELRIRPVLAGTCFKCHGDGKVKGDLRLGSRVSLLKGGKSGPAIVPGDPEKSLLIRALRHDGRADIKMPPGSKLAENVIADFTAWVKNGAPWPEHSSASLFRGQKHWAFEPVRALTPPPDPNGWAKNPIDCFVAAKLREHSLKPVGPAEKGVLLRRIYFDLIGLPPSPADMAEFLVDHSPNAYEKVVDRLLASPHYGERWGRHWLDVARYADTAGDNADYPVPEARLYRDYVIDSFNTDMPYNRFVQEQIAGDILAKLGPRERYAERLVATGFLALSRRYGTAPYELWPLTMEDTIDTTGRAFLGLTLRCARCHDHKFDPVTKEDYYALYGIFASTQFPWAGAEEFSSKKLPREHFVPLLAPEEAATRLATYNQKAKELEAEVRRAEKGKVAQVRAELHDFCKRSLPADLPGAYAVQEGKPLDMYVHIKGEVNEHGPTVKRNVVKFLAGDKPVEIPGDASGRLQLARWLTDSANPLTARVMVNRIWQHHFGQGIVATPSNFGARGDPPTHPELLDWLAARFVTDGWSVRRMHRLIVLSQTYQLAGGLDDADAAADPGNRWYWRHERRRLDAESIRDALLTVSGKMNSNRPQGHPFPPIEQWTWTQHRPFKEVYPSSRRSVYLMTQRFQRHPFLALFDGPDTNTTTEQRATSTVPLQALFLMNNPFVLEQAERFARRLISASENPRLRIELAHEWAWSRRATASEIECGTRYVREYSSRLESDAKGSGIANCKLQIANWQLKESERLPQFAIGNLHFAIRNFPRPDNRAELQAWTSYARIMLMANEFVYLD